MLTVDEALAAVLARSAPLPAKRRRVVDALGCTLAEDVSADIDLPPFDKALVDGYAVRSSDIDSGRYRLAVGEEITAGRMPARPLRDGEAAAIMTGAPLPEGADAVVMVEHSQRDGDHVVLDPQPVRVGMNRLVRGRELRAGDVVLKRGESINPAKVGLLASVGRTDVLVIPPPSVLVLPTGDELVEPDQVPGPSQIRNSNASMLEALARSAGAEAGALPIVTDEPETLHEALGRGLSADVLTITGGVSAGNRDLVPEALERRGVLRVFHKVRLKPGKPLWFGVGPRRGDAPGTLVFGLPGNPVSGIVGFLLFVRPALEVLADRARGRSTPLRYPLARAFRHSSDRPTYYPSRRAETSTGIALDPLDWAGSADLKSVALADGFAVFPAGDRGYVAGDVVEFVELG